MAELVNLNLYSSKIQVETSSTMPQSIYLGYCRNTYSNMWFVEMNAEVFWPQTQGCLVLFTSLFDGKITLSDFVFYY